MSFFPALLGEGGSGNKGSAGLDYQAGQANLINPTSTGQLQTAYDTSQGALKQQQDFLQALQAQNGIGNQSAVYNQLQGISNGTGPNPAQAALNQATGANVANQAALMASQRGAGANAGLIARQAGQQGGAIQQQAAGQGATMQAQQQLNAINAMGGIAGQQVANQANATMGYNQAAQSEQSNLLGAAANYNNAQTQGMDSQNKANSGIAQGLAGSQTKFGYGLINGGAAALAKGGEVPGYAFGDAVAAPAGQAPSLGVDTTMPASKVGFHLFNSASKATPAPQPTPAAATQPVDAAEAAGLSSGKTLVTGLKNLFSSSSSPQSDSMQAPEMGSQFAGSAPSFDIGSLTAAAPPALAKGGRIKGPVNGEQLAAKGKMVPGTAKVKGDSLKNDIVPARLSPGEIVIPRSIAQGKDAPRKAAEFVAAVLAKKGIR